MNVYLGVESADSAFAHSHWDGQFLNIHKKSKFVYKMVYGCKKTSPLSHRMVEVARCETLSNLQGIEDMKYSI